MMESNVVKQRIKRELDVLSSTGYQREQQVTPNLIKRLGLEHELEGHMGCVNCLEWNEKGNLLASGSDDVQVIVWDPFRKRKLTSIRTGHQGNIFTVKFLPSSGDNTIVSGAADSKIRVHDVAANEITHVFTSHTSRVKRIATAPRSPFMFWSAAEDGCVMQFDLRCPEKCQSNNVLVNLDAHMGSPAEFKCIAINPVRSELMAVGANDSYVRVYDRRMLKCQSLKMADEGPNRSSAVEDFTLDRNCVQYYVPGHIPQKKDEYKKKYRALASTYVTFSPDGNELLVNLGGEQIYLFDVNRKRTMQKFDISMVLASNLTSSNGIVKESSHAGVNGYSSYKNGATNGVSKHIQPHASVSKPSNSMSADEDKSDSQKQTDKKILPPIVESLKKKANLYFQKEEYTKAIILYNQAITRAPHASMLYGNRAAAYMKRKWDGDIYAALRDCHIALKLDLNHLKAHFRLAKCLNELAWPKEAFECLKHFKTKFPDYATSRACEQLDKDIRAAMFSKSEHDSRGSRPSPLQNLSHSMKPAQVSEMEQVWRSEASDYEARFCGHCNTTTDIKEANFFGSNGQYIVAGSDDGSFFIWEKSTTNIVRVLRGDDSIVNCLQPHPSSCMLATSGIDPVVRLWSPRPEDGTKNEREVDNSDDAALANQKRMNADPLEVMLMNMGYRLSGSDEGEGDGDRRGHEGQMACPTS